MNTLKRILYEVGICVIGTYIYSLVSNQSFWEIQLPLWFWLTIIIVLTVLFYVVDYIITQYRVKRLVTDFTECAFGDSYVYTWKYKRTYTGRYNAYGYEATDIHTKTPLSEMNNGKRFICGHEVPEETIKMFIQLIIVANIDKKMGKTLQPVLEYLHWIEDSQKHKLLHL